MNLSSLSCCFAWILKPQARPHDVFEDTFLGNQKTDPWYTGIYPNTDIYGLFMLHEWLIFMANVGIYIYTYIINLTLSVRIAMQYPGSPMVFHRKVTSSFRVHFPATVYCFSFWIYLMIYKVLYIPNGFSPDFCHQPYVKLPQQSASSSRREISSFSLDVVK